MRESFSIFLLAVVAFAGGDGGDLAKGAPTTAIAPNGFGTLVSSQTPGFYNIQGGTTMGNNLFHSFSTFNLGTGGTVDFNVSSNVANVLARVTGGPSSIDGTITSTIGPGGPLSSANLFLINPAGVMFTANAQVNLGGSFIVTTANYVKLSDGSIFYGDVTHPVQDAGLTSAPVSAFGFLSSTPQPISFAGSQITGRTGTMFGVIGGDISLDQGSPNGFTERGTVLTEAAGTVALFSAASSGEVPFNPASLATGFASATTPSLGNIALRNASVLDIDSTRGGGAVVIRGGKLTVNNATIRSINYSSRAGGGISLQSDEVDVQNGGKVVTKSMQTGDAGNISINANTMNIDDAEIVSATSGAGTYSAKSGLIAVNAEDSLSLTNGGLIENTTSTAGEPGGITVNAANVTIDGTAPNAALTGITSVTEPGATGSGGNISVTTTNALSIKSGQISSVGNSTGAAGNVTVQAGSLSVEGGASQSLQFGVTSQSASSSPAGGNAGSVSVHVDGALVLSGAGAEIAASTSTSGNAGDVTVQAGSIQIDGGNSFTLQTGILSNGLQNASGNGGNVRVTTTGALVLQNGGLISSSTDSTTGNAGNVVVQAGSLSIVGGHAQTGIVSGCGQGAVSSSSAAGDVTVNVSGSVRITDGQIESDANSSSPAGVVVVNAGALTIQGGGQANSSSNYDYSQISADSDGSLTSVIGNAGSVTVNVAGALSILQLADISSNTLSRGNGGSVLVNAGSILIDGENEQFFLPNRISPGISSQASASGNGGDVSVTTTGALLVENSGVISASTSGNGNAGQVTVQAGSLTIQGADQSGSFLTGIISTANPGPVPAHGNAGSVNVEVGGTLTISDLGQISGSTHTAGEGGNVMVQAQSIIMAGISSPGLSTGITAQATAAGNGGNIMIDASGVTLLTGAAISSSSKVSNAGNILVTARNLSLEGNSTISTSAGRSGGSIMLKVVNLTYLLNSQITAAAGSNGGNITIDPQFMVMDNSLISANAAQGEGGNILIEADNFIPGQSLITATGSTDGTITVASPDLDLSGSLIALPAVLTDNEKRLRESCARSVNHEFSSFIVVGRGGTESGPEELQPDFGLGGDR